MAVTALTYLRGMAGASTTAVDVVAYGRPATEALAARINAAKVAHPLAPVTIVVPSNMAGLAVRRLLGSGELGSSGLANVAFVTPFRLAELLGSGSLGDRRPLTNPVLAAAVRAVLAEEPGPLAEVADHHATHAALTSLYGELSRARPETLERIAAASERGAEVVRLVGAVRSRLGAFYDEDDLADAARSQGQADPSAVAGLGTVVWHLPGRSSPAMLRLIGTVLAATPSAVVAPATGVPELDDETARLCVAAGVPVERPATSEPPTARRIVSVSDPDEEVRAVVREVLALAEAGTPLDRIAVFHPRAEPYARTLLEQLDGAGVPHNGPAPARLSGTAAGRTLLAALALRPAGWGRGEVMALVAGGPVRSGDRLASSGRWEALSRQAGVVGGLDDWRAKLTAAAETLRAQRQQLDDDPDATDGRKRALEGDAVAAEELLAFVQGLAASLHAVEAATTWANRSHATLTLLGFLLGPEHGRPASWPDHEVDAASRVEAAVARLAALDELEPSPSPAAFELAVAAELDAPTRRVGRFGQGVLVAPLSTAVGLDLDAVFVLGMTEGACPWFRRDDSLLPDADRELAVDGELVTSAQRLRDQHRSYLAAVAAGTAARTLLLPRGDLRDRRHRRPSRWLLDSAAALAGRDRVFSSDVGDLALVEQTASFAHGLSTAPAHASEVERDVAVLLAHQQAGGDPADHPVVAGDLARAVACQRARASDAFTEWDGNLAGQPVPSPARGVVLSPSRLETWAACPLKYYFSQVLRLRDRDDPERIVEMAPTDRGTLVHEILERFVGEAIDRPGGPPEPSEAWTDADRARVREIAAEAFARWEGEGRTGRALAWRRTQADILSDLDAFLTADDTHRAARDLRPAQVEMTFGMEGEPPLSLELADGRTLTFRGSADRVDVSPTGPAAVLDYKTGSDKYTKLDEDPFQQGTTLQLGVYAEAARERLDVDDVEASYWMASRKASFAQRGYRWDDERRRRFLEVVGTIVDGIEGGVFPGRSGEFEFFWHSYEACRYCDFDRICPRERDDHQRAKAGAPELSLLERLQPPGEEPER
jgi:ATP-dependent helicase/nuclease subunit B